MESPKYIQLKSPAFLSPALFNATGGIVENESHITIEGVRIDSNEPLIVGEPFIFRIGAYYPEIIYKRELDAYNDYCENEKQAAIAKFKQHEIKRLEPEKQHRIEFWAKYNIPFQFSIQIKEVLSGLGVNSNCTGTKRNSVTHIYLHENIEFGRVKRQSNDFLCSNSKARYGGNWSGTLELGSDKGNIVTCKQCLKLMEKFKIG